MISAKVLADSISSTGSRVTTMEVVMHRFVLAEFNTHRMFSRNSASSRAIPIEKRIKAVIEDPAIPLHWGKNQKGMQAEVELEESERIEAESVWLGASQDAAESAKLLSDLGIHKQIANRILEPFLWHTAVVTATEWQNFFAQRCSPLAQPEIRAVAEAMRTALGESEPIREGIHLPYVTREERSELTMWTCSRLAVARCARVSYLTHDGRRDTNEDLALYDKLATATPPHASPFEHVCRPIEEALGPMGEGKKQIGNLIGWRQLRHEVFGA